MRSADIQVNVNSVQSLRGLKMASENTVFYEKPAEAVRNYPRLYNKSSDDFKDTNKKSFAGKMLQKRFTGVSTGEVNII